MSNTRERSGTPQDLERYLLRRDVKEWLRAAGPKAVAVLVEHLNGDHHGLREDLLRHQGDPELLRVLHQHYSSSDSAVAIVEQLSETKAPPDDGVGPIRLLSLDELLAQPPANPLVHGILSRGDLACIYGAPGAGKSFLALDLALSVAGLRRQWAGHDLHHGPTVYVAGEGLSGLRCRVSAALMDEAERPRLGVHDRFWVVGSPVQLWDQGEAGRLLDTLGKLEHPPVLVVLDTMARCMSGKDENSAMDVGSFVGGCDRVRIATGATVLVVHHQGKDSTRGARGSTAWIGAVDMAAQAEMTGSTIRLTSTKAKDLPPFETLEFSLITVSGVGEDSAGRPIGSAKVVQTGAWKGGEVSKRQLSKPVLDYLELAAPEDGAAVKTICDHLNAAQSSVYYELTRLVEEGCVEPNKKKSRTFYRIRGVGKARRGSEVEA